MCQSGTKLCACIRVGSCFAPETKITMADGSEMEISKLSVGDMVWNPVLKKPARVKKILEGPEAKPLIEFGYGDVTVKVTTGHPVPVLSTKEQAELSESTSLFKRASYSPDPRVDEKFTGFTKIVKASELKEGDVIRDSQNNFHVLTIVRKIPISEGQYVVNVSLDAPEDNVNEHYLLANGIISGDLHLQVQLGENKLPIKN